MGYYKDLEIYQLAFRNAIEVHHLSLKLPKYELYEQGSQVRRSSKSIKDNIVEGYGRRRYKSDYLKFLTYAHASLLECKDQLETIDVLYQPASIKKLVLSYDKLGAKIYTYIVYVEKNWQT